MLPAPTQRVYVGSPAVGSWRAGKLTLTRQIGSCGACKFGGSYAKVRSPVSVQPTEGSLVGFRVHRKLDSVGPPRFLRVHVVQRGTSCGSLEGSRVGYLQFGISPVVSPAIQRQESRRPSPTRRVRKVRRYGVGRPLHRLWPMRLDRGDSLGFCCDTAELALAVIQPRNPPLCKGGPGGIAVKAPNLQICRSEEYTSSARFFVRLTRASLPVSPPCTTYTSMEGVPHVPRPSCCK